jgi:hypothetical protein
MDGEHGGENLDPSNSQNRFSTDDLKTLREAFASGLGGEGRTGLPNLFNLNAGFAVYSQYSASAAKPS